MGHKTSGLINANVVQVTSNGLCLMQGKYGNETGSLKLELNGTVIRTAGLALIAGAGNPASGSTLLTDSTGFTNISVTASALTVTDRVVYIQAQKCKIYLCHRFSKMAGITPELFILWGTDYATNYIEWINDPSGAVDDLAASNERIENISLVGSNIYLV